MRSYISWTGPGEELGLHSCSSGDRVFLCFMYRYTTFVQQSSGTI